jgi:hypothetical protein
MEAFDENFEEECQHFKLQLEVEYVSDKKKSKKKKRK